MNAKIKKNSIKAVLYTSLILICISWVFPLLFMLLTALRTNEEIRFEGFSFFPKHFTFATFEEVLSNTKSAPVLQWFVNSFIVSVSSAILILFIDSMAAYGYARLHFKLNHVLFMLLMASMMIPGVINLIPNYVIVTNLGLKNNLLALILPGLGGVGNIFLIRQFIYSVPKDFDEAAKIDGAGEIRVFFIIILPQIVPVLAVVALFTFIGSWNDLLWPLIVIQDVQRRTLTAGLSLLNGAYDAQQASKMAAAVISIIPVFILYLFAQKFLLQGISLSSGIKE